MADVYLSLGSNINRVFYINSCIEHLQQAFDVFVQSSIYESEAVGFDGENFYNLVVGIKTALPLAELAQKLREIEDKHDRDRTQARFSARTLDIDILTYDDLVGVNSGISLPRDEILKNAFVLWPMAEVAPEVLHPELKQSYQTLWSEFDKTSQKLWVVDTPTA